MLILNHINNISGFGQIDSSSSGDWQTLSLELSLEDEELAYIKRKQQENTPPPTITEEISNYINSIFKSITNVVNEILM
jgi:hypothetical protein